MQPYKRLVIWMRSDEFVKLTYHVTKRFPDDERFGLTSQLRRAALSVALNIVEGNARGSDADFRRFLFISRGSLAESAYLLELALHLGYMTRMEYDEVERARNQASYCLQQFVLALDNRLNPR
ncbi:MAG: four helix bundle protein [Candidatus Uhrbacteria bacterium]|nr:four helix bundle protein [Candidatus Uhrbacteria bacterium]